jgi:hypothetical protein
MELLDKLLEISNEFEKKKTELVNEIKPKLGVLFAELFKDFDQVEYISWNQYTPYFNDGDTCEFGVNSDITVNGLDSWDHPELNDHKYIKLTEENIEEHREFNFNDKWYYNKEIGETGRFPNENFNSKLSLAVAKISMLVDKIPEQILLEMFGDHKIISIYKDGQIKVDHYEHD